MDLKAVQFTVSCMTGDMNAVKKYVEGGNDINARGVSGSTGLAFACNNSQLDVITYLLEHGADPTIQDDYGFSVSTDPTLSTAVKTLLKNYSKTEDVKLTDDAKKTMVNAILRSTTKNVNVDNATRQMKSLFEEKYDADDETILSLTKTYAELLIYNTVFNADQGIQSVAKRISEQDGFIKRAMGIEDNTISCRNFKTYGDRAIRLMQGLEKLGLSTPDEVNLGLAYLKCKMVDTAIYEKIDPYKIYTDLNEDKQTFLSQLQVGKIERYI